MAAVSIEGLAQPGGVCISRKVYDHVEKKLGPGYEYPGKHSVRNISEPVRSYRVKTGIVSVGNDVNEKGREGLFRIRNIVVVLIIIIAFWHPIHSSVRKLPAFKAYIRDIGLYDYWHATDKWPDLCRSLGDDDFECD